MANKFINKIIALTVTAASLLFATGCNSSTSSSSSQQPPVKYTVVFDVNAGDDIVENSPDSVRVDSGTPVSRPALDPSRRGYDFVDWFLNPEGTGASYDFSTPVTRNNLIIYAVWEIAVVYRHVTFDFMDGRDDVIVDVIDNHKLAEPSEPVRENYVFSGWYLNEGLSTQYNFDNEVTEDFVLYARWIRLFTVTFDFNYEGAPADDIQVIESGNTAEEPELPARDDYTFGGWFRNTGLTEVYSFEAVTSDITVYAKWIYSVETPSYTVEFVYNYESAPANVVRTVAEGAIVTQPSTVRENYRFLGWYLDNTTFLTRFYTSTTPVTENLTLYAKWIRTYILALDYNYQGAINPANQTVDEGASLAGIQNPSRVGYVFEGWSSTAKGNIDIVLSNGITKNTTFYAQWSKTFVFEAEYLDFSDFFGWGFSGNATGTDAILEDTSGTGQGQVSNNHFVTYLYGKGITLTYEIYSDRAVTDATLTLRLSGEVKDFFIQSEKTFGVTEEEPVYTVKVNGQKINYGKIYFTNVPPQSANTLLPFQDFVLSTTVSLVEGKNTILLITDNELQMGGTMTATAPMVDCLKIKTYAVLTWNPILDNY